MPDSVQESVLEAINNIVHNRIDRLQTDKTITATVVQCNNSLTGEHQVNYQGGNIIAYSQDGASYSKNASVYVLVPEGNFSQKKIILGFANTNEDDNNITFVSSLINDYNTIGRNVIKHKSDKSAYLHSYLKEDYFLIYDHDGKEENNLVTIDIEEFQNYLLGADAVMFEASFMTRLPTAHRNTKTGLYGLQFVLAFKDRSTDEELIYKTYSYVLDTNNMTGNPYAFNTFSDQYGIFPIDTENFSHIQTILFYSYGFEEKDDKINNELWGADIWCNYLEVYGLQHIDETNGDYRLRISTPDGATFKAQNPNSSLEAIATLKHQNTYLSDSTMFYWFKEDARVTTSSPDYQMYGGTGWSRLKEKGTKANILVYENENKAYENKYLCVAVYKETVILKSYFTIYNDAMRRSIGITSNLGVKFSFDRGEPILTCELDGKESGFDAGTATNKPDSYFTFMWSKIDEFGQVTPFTKTQAELEQEYKNGYGKLSYAELANIQSQITLMADVKFPKGINGNKLQYPVKSIDNFSTFRCSVYMKDSANGESYFIGSADITLQNEGAANPNDYYILIENGDQVFQYSESGVSPTSERYQDPLVVFPLYCHFYDPAGLEINQSTYSIKWLVPLTDTMIKIPTELQYNPSTSRNEWYVESIYPMDIVNSFDYQALNNQITCIVTYQGETYTKDTRFSFVKVGDNGTNGTDIVAKISPKSQSTILDNDMLAIEVNTNSVASWNTGQSISTKVLDFTLFQREQKILPEGLVSWSIAGTNSNIISVSGDKAGAAVSYLTKGTGTLRNQIVKAQTVLADELGNSTTHYAFFPIPIIKYNQNNYKVHIDTDFTLKQILYNADGHNPLYNKNQGFRISIKSNTTSTDRTVFVEAIGGLNSSQTTSAFKLISEKNSTDGKGSLILDLEDNVCECYILPEDVYSGMYTNNMIHGKVFQHRNQVSASNATPEAEFWIPIHMQLNTYGLQSLNAWDGNHIEINEEGEYILAPQIGAGEKNNKNQFTGIVMGKVETYDQTLKKQWSNGLLGYSNGEQSIFLDAKTGDATFGLNSDIDDTNNPQSAGRIELRPRGTSRISRWKFDKTSLYNANIDGTDVDAGPHYSDITMMNSFKSYPLSIPHWAQGVMLSSDPAYVSIKGRRLSSSNSQIDFTNANIVITEGDTFEVQLNPNDSSLFTIYRHTNAVDSDFYIETRSNKMYVRKMGSNLDYSVANYKNNNSPREAEITGWTLKYNINGKQTNNSTDTYILPEKGSGSKATWALRGVKASSVFKANATINYPSGSQILLKAEEGVWRREPKVGIDEQGRFYANSLQDNTTALTIGSVAAFGKTALNKAYVGAEFEVGSGSNLIKFFTDANALSSKDEATSTLYLTGSTSVNSEYQRPISIHGDSVSLYAKYPETDDEITNNQKTSTNNFLTIRSGYGEWHQNKSLISLQGISNESTSTMTITGKLNETISAAKTTQVTGAVTEIYKNTLTQETAGDVKLTWKKAATATITNDLNVVTGTANSGFQFTTNNSTTTGSLRLGSRKGTIPAWPPIADGNKVYSNGSVRSAISTAAFIDLKSGSTDPSTIVSSSGLDLATNNGPIRMFTWGSDQGIQLLANPPSGAPNAGILLSLVPQQGGGGTFTLQSPSAVLQSMSFLAEYPNTIGGKSEFSGISAMPGLNTTFVSIIDNKTNNVNPKYGLMSSRPIQVNGGTTKGSHSVFQGYLQCGKSAIAENFEFDKTYQFPWGQGLNNNYTYYHSYSVYDCIAKLFDIVLGLRQSVVSTLTDWSSKFNSHTHEFNGQSGTVPVTLSGNVSIDGTYYQPGIQAYFYNEQGAAERYPQATGEVTLQNKTKNVSLSGSASWTAPGGTSKGPNKQLTFS